MERYEHGGQIYDATGKIGDWLDFSANINPFTSEKIFKTLAENLRGIVNYPDAHAAELKNAICRRYDVSANNLVLLNGAAEFFYLYMFVTRPKRVVIPVPSFGEYERAARAAGCDVKFFQTHAENNFTLDVDALLKILSPEDCVMLANPNNPTGNLLTVEKILRIAEISRVIVDESFIDFTNAPSVKNFVSEKISAVRSLTKIFAIPGLRLGFALVDEISARKLNSAKDVWNVNFLAQKVGAEILADDDFLRQTRIKLVTEQKFFVNRLSKLPIKIFPPSANFVLFKVKSTAVAEKILHDLRQKRILLRHCANFVGLDGSFLRTAIRSHEENLRLLAALEKLEVLQ